HMLGQAELPRALLPLGAMTKAEVRELALRLGLRTAAKPDSRDVCFISRTAGRGAFLADRIPLRPGRVVDGAGVAVGTVPAVELVTIGQRRGIATAPGGTGGDVAARRYVTRVDVATATVTVGSLEDLLVRTIALQDPTWVAQPPPAGASVEVQSSAHGEAVGGVWGGVATVHLDRPVRRVAPGQSVVLYNGDAVLGGGMAPQPASVPAHSRG
ncbi:MAG: aminomethyltransferase beta-barrel domain-containing protein, partial [Acidimicrobiales bacterium]